MPAMIARQGTIPANAGARDPISTAAGAGAVVRPSACTAVAVLWESTFRKTPRPSEAEARRLMYAYADGAYVTVRRIFGERLRCNQMTEFQERFGPTYPDLRDFLECDCNVDSRIAARLAFGYIARHTDLTRHRREYGEGERGWI